MLISPAYAQAGGDAGGGLMAFLPLILIFVVFYFLLIRPQQQRMKRHKEMLSNIRRGDRVVTNGGIFGQVMKVGDDELNVEIADGVRVKVMRSMVAEVVAKTEPVKGGKSKDSEDEDEDEPAAEVVQDDAKPTKSEGLRSLLGGKDKK